MNILRTPDACFANLKDWPYAPHYHDIINEQGQPLRMAYIDEGPRDGPVVLLLHGEPTWSYLYRHCIPPLVAAGCRVLAPDLIGFGRSDKPAERSDYTYNGHVAWLSNWFLALGVQKVTLFCQDWGGLLGLRMVAAMPERFAGVVASNTGLPTGRSLGEGFEAWRIFSQSGKEMRIGRIVFAGTVNGLDDDEVAAYDAPFPDESFKSGARQFPLLVPITAEHAAVAENVQAWETLKKSTIPFVTAFSDADMITRGGDTAFQKFFPGALGQSHTTLKGGHFIQEDSPTGVVEVILGLLKGGAKPR